MVGGWVRWTGQEREQNRTVVAPNEQEQVLRRPICSKSLLRIRATPECGSARISGLPRVLPLCCEPEDSGGG